MNCSQPLCCKGFLGNATSRQQQWANSVQKLRSNHLFMTGRNFQTAAILLRTEETLLLHISIPARWNPFTLSPFAHFVGPVGITSCCFLHQSTSSHHYIRWTYTHLHHCMKTQGGLADNSFPFSAYFHPT